MLQQKPHAKRTNCAGLEKDLCKARGRFVALCIPMNVDTGTLANIASVIAAFGAAMLFFRIQRELEMVGKGQRVWLPWADRLLIAATLLCLLFVILPLLSTTTTSLPAAAAAAAAVLVAGYVFALLAHYRIVF